MDATEDVSVLTVTISGLSTAGDEEPTPAATESRTVLAAAQAEAKRAASKKSGGRALAFSAAFLLCYLHRRLIHSFWLLDLRFHPLLVLPPSISSTFPVICALP